MDANEVWTQKSLNGDFGLEKVVNAQLFKGRFELSRECQHWPALAFRDGTKTIKQKVTILTSVEMVAQKFMKRTKIE